MKLIAWLALTCLGAGAQRPEFEVATVKPSAPRLETPAMRQVNAALRDFMPSGTISTAPNRMQMRQQPLVKIVASAWSVRASQVSGPAWMSEDMYDIEGRFPVGARDQVHEMLQALLDERFGVKLHREQVSHKGYALVVGKDGPRLQAAAPPDISRSDEPLPPPPPREPLTPGMQRSEYKGVTASTLAAILARMVEDPVVDLTGLAGKYDFVLETSRDTPDNPGATIFQTIGDLRLKLDRRKVQIDMLIIDDIRRAPAPN